MSNEAEYQRRIERLVYTRNLYTNWHRAQVRTRQRYLQWKRQLQFLSNQKKELKKLQSQLVDKNQHYNQICQEIGSGHRAAEIYSFYEKRAKETNNQVHFKLNLPNIVKKAKEKPKSYSIDSIEAKQQAQEKNQDLISVATDQLSISEIESDCDQTICSQISIRRSTRISTTIQKVPRQVEKAKEPQSNASSKVNETSEVCSISSSTVITTKRNSIENQATNLEVERRIKRLLKELAINLCVKIQSQLKEVKQVDQIHETKSTVNNSIQFDSSDSEEDESTLKCLKQESESKSNKLNQLNQKQLNSKSLSSSTLSSSSISYKQLPTVPTHVITINSEKQLKTLENALNKSDGQVKSNAPKQIDSWTQTDFFSSSQVDKQNSCQEELFCCSNEKVKEETKTSQNSTREMSNAADSKQVDTNQSSKDKQDEEEESESTLSSFGSNYNQHLWMTLSDLSTSINSLSSISLLTSEDEEKESPLQRKDGKKSENENSIRKGEVKKGKKQCRYLRSLCESQLPSKTSLNESDQIKESKSIIFSSNQIWTNLLPNCDDRIRNEMRNRIREQVQKIASQTNVSSSSSSSIK